MLSVRVEDRSTQLLCVEHFEVGIGDGGTYFVERNRDFSGFSKLIEYYMSAKNYSVCLERRRRRHFTWIALRVPVVLTLNRKPGALRHSADGAVSTRLQAARRFQGARSAAPYDHSGRAIRRRPLRRRASRQLQPHTRSGREGTQSQCIQLFSCFLCATANERSLF